MLIGLGLVTFYYGPQLATAINRVLGAFGQPLAFIPTDPSTASLFSLLPLILVVFLVILLNEQFGSGELIS